MHRYDRKPRDVGGEHRHCPGLSTPSSDYGGELVDTLQRLALSAGQIGEGLALVLAEFFAHGGNHSVRQEPKCRLRSRCRASWGLRTMAAERVGSFGPLRVDAIGSPLVGAVLLARYWFNDGVTGVRDARAEPLA